MFMILNKNKSVELNVSTPMFLLIPLDTAGFGTGMMKRDSRFDSKPTKHDVMN
jgi:hypothetical protein